MAYFDAPYRPADLTVDSSHSLVANMVAWFPLTQGSGSVAQCILHPSHTGTLGSGVTWETSERGTSVFSDGSNLTGGINTGNPSSVQITGDLTIAAWVKCDNATPSSNQYIVSKYDAGSGQRAYAIALLSSGSVRFTYQSSGNPYNSAEDVDSSATLTAGSWHFVVGTFQASTAGKIYIDGELDTSNTSSVPSSIFNSSADLYISGIDGASGPSNCFEGNIQNVKVWSRALSATEVKTLHARPWTASNFDTEALWLSPPASPTLSSASEATALMANCVGWWPLVEGSGSTATDLVGSNNGTLNSDVAWGTSSVGTVAVFDDSLTSQITVPHDSSYNAATTGKISVSAWVKVDATRSDHSVIIGKDDNGSNREWLITIPTNLSVFRLHLWDSSASLSYFDTSSFSLGEWHFVCMTWDGSTLQGYLDGVADGSASINSARTTTVGLRVGESSNNKLDGLLQNARIFDAALTADQVRLLYERPWIGAAYNETAPLYPPVPSSLTPLDSSNSILTSLEAWWPLTQATGSTCTDISGNSLDGTQNGTEVWQNSELGFVHKSSGTSQNYFDNCGSTSDFAFAHTTGIMTVSCWIRPTATGRSFILANNDTSGANGFFFDRKNGDGMNFYMGTSGVGGGTSVSTANGTAPSDGTWQHWVFVLDTGNSVAQFFKNGVAVTTTGTIAGTGTGSTKYTTALGGLSSVPSETFDGDLQNVRVWSRALSSTEVADIYYSPWLGSAYPSTGGGTPSYFVAAQFNRLGIGPRFRRL